MPKFHTHCISALSVALALFYASDAGARPGQALDSVADEWPRLLEPGEGLADRTACALLLSKRVKGETYFADKDFAAHVVSLSDSPTYVPASLVKTAQEKIGGLIERFKARGFGPRAYIYALIEAEEFSIMTGSRARDSKSRRHTIIWDEEDRRYQYLSIVSSDDPMVIGVPADLEYRPLKPPRDSQVMIIGVSSNGEHGLSNTMGLAHEIAHGTEPPTSSSHGCMMWREARADILASIITGESEVVVDGEVVRDLANPLVKTMDDLIPSAHSYHVNSEAISGFLYLLKTRMGDRFIADFVKWMDKTPSQYLPQILVKDGDPMQRFDAPGAPALLAADEATALVMIESNLRLFKGLFLRWLDAQAIKQNDKSALRALAESQFKFGSRSLDQTP